MVWQYQGANWIISALIARQTWPINGAPVNISRFQMGQTSSKLASIILIFLHDSFGVLN